jgi:hypothetical protein
MSSFFERLNKLSGNKLDRRINENIALPAVMRPDIREIVESQRRRNLMPDYLKPQFVINSLDKRNNDPLKGNLLDSFSGATDVKPIPAATFSGSVSSIPVLKN